MLVNVGPLPVITKDGKHTAAYICGPVFRKRLRLSNKLKSPPGWTLDSEFIIKGQVVKLAGLLDYGITTIQIQVIENPGTLLVAGLKTFNEHGVPVDRGTGDHVALADPFWRPINFYKLF